MKRATNRYQNLLCALATACLLLAAGCGKGKEAQQALAKAQTLYEQKQYGAAKNAIDTLRAHYPKEIDVLKASLVLMRQVERAESARNIAYCDSLTTIRMQEAEQLKKDFVLEKEAAYEDVGNYVWKQQTIERNVGRSYIRCGVNEKGELYLASVYYGAQPIQHTGLKISTPNGTFAETPAIAYDGGANYRFANLGNTTEVVTYKGAYCLDVVNLVCQTDQKTRIKAEYTGGKTFSMSLSVTDQQAIRAAYNLAAVLTDLEAMHLEKEKSLKKIAYLDEKLSATAQAPQ